MHTIQTIMTVNPITVEPDALLGAVAEMMHLHGFRHLPVVEDSRLVGIVTDRDVRSQQRSLVFARIPVRTVMTPNPITVTPETTIEEACRILRQYKFDALPVVSGDRLVGIVTLTDLVGALHVLAEARSATDGGW